MWYDGDTARNEGQADLPFPSTTMRVGISRTADARQLRKIYL